MFPSNFLLWNAESSLWTVLDMRLVLPVYTEYLDKWRFSGKYRSNKDNPIAKVSGCFLIIDVLSYRRAKEFVVLFFLPCNYSVWFIGKWGNFPGFLKFVYFSQTKIKKSKYMYLLWSINIVCRDFLKLAALKIFHFFLVIHN